MSIKLFTTAAAALLISQVSWAQQTTSQQDVRREQREINQAQREAAQEINQSQREMNRAQRDLNDAQRDARKALNQQERNSAAVVQASTNQSVESKVAHCLIQANQNEIELLRFGIQHAQSDKVKQAAQSMIRDHEQLVQRLQQFDTTNNNNADRTSRSSTSTQTRTDRDTTAVQIDRNGVRIESVDNDQRLDAPAGRQTVQAGYAPQQDPMQQIAEEAARNCLKMTKDELAELKGEKFDHAFLGQQCGAHVQMIAFLKAVDNHVSPDMQQVVRDGLQSSKKHKDHLEQLKEELHK